MNRADTKPMLQGIIALLRALFPDKQYQVDLHTTFMEPQKITVSIQEEWLAEGETDE
jgi:hypothetical protein